MFPLYINYKKEIELDNPEVQTVPNILAYFEKVLNQKRADNIVVEKYSLTFKNNLFKLINNWNIMLPVDSGEIGIKMLDNNRIAIEYIFSLRRILLIAAIASFFVSGGSESVLTGFIAFAWLGGMNWLIAIIRHRCLFNNIIYDIQQWKESTHSNTAYKSCGV